MFGEKRVWRLARFEGIETRLNFTNHPGFFSRVLAIHLHLPFPLRFLSFPQRRAIPTSNRSRTSHAYTRSVGIAIGTNIISLDKRKEEQEQRVDRGRYVCRNFAYEIIAIGFLTDRTGSIKNERVKSSRLNVNARERSDEKERKREFTGRISTLP